MLTKLPYDVAAFFLWDELRDNEKLLIDMFKPSLFVSYFRELTAISFEVGDGFTKPPTVSPTVTPPDLSALLQEEEEEQKAAERRSLFTAVGIGLGILWLLLTLCSIHQIVKHRRKAQEQQKLKRMQQQPRQSHHPGRGRGKGLKRIGSAQHLPLRQVTMDWRGRIRKKRSTRFVDDDIMESGHAHRRNSANKDVGGGGREHTQQEAVSSNSSSEEDTSPTTYHPTDATMATAEMTDRSPKRVKPKKLSVSFV